MKTISLRALAKSAGVGLATVDRVLNERGGVSPKTTRKVLDAARQSGIKRILPEEHTHPWKIEVFLSINDSIFFKDLTKSLAKIADSLGYRRITLHKTYIPESSPKKMAQLITASMEKRDGIIVFSNEHPDITTSINKCVANGFPVITLVTDHPDAKKLCHVGIDHIQAGRTAAKLMGRLLKNKGEILIISGREDYLNHRQRIEAFRSFMVEHFPEFTLRNTVKSEEDRLQILSLVNKEMHECDNVIGVYNTGLGNTQVSQVLKKFCLERKVVYITHELDETTKGLLGNDVVDFTIDSNITQHTQLALNVMLNFLEKNETPEIYTDGKVNFILYTSENI